MIRKLLIPLIVLALAIAITASLLMTWTPWSDGPGTEYSRSLVVKADVWPGGDLGEDGYGDKIVIMFIVPDGSPWPLRADEALKDIGEGKYDDCWRDEAEIRFGYVPIMVCPTPGYTRTDFIGARFRIE